MLKGIIFDVDGVLINTENTHFLAYRKVLETYAYDLAYEKYKQHFSGKSIKGGVLSLLQETPLITINQQEEFIQTITKNKISQTIEIFRKEVVFFEDTLKFINGVKDGNITLNNIGYIEQPPIFALTTGLEKVLIDEVLKYHNLNNIFSIIITPEKYSKSKPDPECYLNTLNEMHCLPEESIGIEDSPSGIQALNAAGIFSVAITNTFEGKDLSQAKIVTDSLSKLL